MRGAAAANRRAKRDVIVIDDDEPAEKSARRETEASSPSVILPARQETTEATGSVDGRRTNVYGLPPPEQLLSVAEQFKSFELRRKLLESEQKLLESDEKLANSEQKFQRLCTMSGELKARVEFLENIIDKKPNTVGDANKDRRIEELEKKLIDVTNQLEEERKGRMDDSERNEKRISNLESQLEEDRKSRMKDRNRSDDLPNELVSGEIPSSTEEIPRVENTGYSTNILELCDLKSCKTTWVSFRNALTILKTPYDECEKSWLSKLCRVVIKNEILDCFVCGMRIDSNGLFYHFFSKGHNENALSSGQGLPMYTVKFWLEKMEQAKDTVIHNECHPTNLFQLCRSDLPESIPFDRAHDLLQSALNKYEECNDNRDQVNEYIRDQALEFPFCEVCRFTGTIHMLFFHMLGKKHSKKARSLGGNVSLAAVNFWIRQLEEADTAVGSGRMKADSAAAAVAARVESNNTVLIELD